MIKPRFRRSIARSFQSFTALLVLFVFLTRVAGFAQDAAPSEPPVIPVGLDSYRQWEKWPLQRIGVRAYMRGTYDRSGGNEGADASHFLYQLATNKNVTLDVAGKGILYFARYNHWHGSPWRYVVDGTEHVIQESTTPDPKHPVADSVFVPENAFPKPLAWTWSDTKGADLSWVPIPFEKMFRMGYSRTHYGTGYYIYHLFADDTKTSSPIRSWNIQTPPARDVLELIDKSGTDLAPARAAEESGILEKLKPSENRMLVDFKTAPSVLRKLSFSVPEAEAIAFGRARLRITWDERRNPSVDAPVALFFGAGTLYNRDHREYLVKAFPSYVRFAAGRVELASFFPMPFFNSARIELAAPETESLEDIRWSIKHAPFKTAPEKAGYFHATFRDHPTPAAGQDLVLLDTRTAEGGGDWSGSFIGCSWIFSTNANLGTLEGDPRFFFDDSQTPQAYGTGTEEWGGGGDYWGGGNMTLPFAGHPCGAPSAKAARGPEDKIESAYRFLLADLMPFGKNAVIRLEHGGENLSREHYQSVTYWYGAPAPSLVRTDVLQIGDTVSEKAHRYSSPDASEPYEITSRYEWGIDTLPNSGTVVYPAETDEARKTTSASEFTLKLNPENLGVLLRRKLDYAVPNQRAEVFIADAESEKPNWQSAGIWYLAGSSTCVYSNPRDELGATEHHVQTSNRRFRDDEFLLPRRLTQGRSAIRVRVKSSPVEIPLFPGPDLPELAWTEIRYDAYCVSLPKWQP
jgi:hypothetical protein